MNNLSVDVYTDGSHSTRKAGVGWGLTMTHTGGDFDPIYEVNGLIMEPSMVRLRNVAGEVTAAAHAIRIALQTGIKIRLHYDYEGVEYWVTGVYRAKSPISIAYQRLAVEAYNKGLIEFIKIKSHTGNIGNTRADELAKMALDGEEIKYNKLMQG